ncbi:MAG: calcium/sodium antiporter [Paludibacter sp.]|nr:calcium/sodium antiporter [Paludibacter sp.]MDD4198634.1 calcium/sodium antiporter [Paludibacter sp.]MDD4427901.1 calcium/sodium antiporter [Paludibacter sp.]
MLLQTSLLVLGFVLLIKGADWLVNGATALAKKHQVSDLAIGLTIVAFGTSMPELVVNAFAAFENHPEIVYGNIIGSNNFNLFMILGIAGLITPLVVQSSTVWKEIPFSLAAAILLFFLANDFFADSGIGLSRLDGVILLLFFAGFLYYVYKQLRTGNIPETSTTVVHYSNLKIWGLILLGLALLVIGGRLVVDSAVEIASALGVSQTLIGLTIVAAGTSLPELATSVVAAIKKNNDIAVGNIIGSNIFNIFFILGVSSLIRPIPFSLRFNQDIYLLIFGTVLLFLTMFSGKKKKLDRWEAGLLLAMYVGYTVYLIGGEV